MSLIYAVSHVTSLIRNVHLTCTLASSACKCLQNQTGPKKKLRMAKLVRTSVQQKAMKLIGPGTLLQSLSLRRMVAATTYLYKLHYTTDPPQLTQLLPHAAAPHPNPYTRLQLKAHHQFQLLNPLPRNAPDYLQRSFPYSIIKSWNNLPPNLLVRYPHEKGIQLFKTLACKHHIQRDWLWATNFAR